MCAQMLEEVTQTANPDNLLEGLALKEVYSFYYPETEKVCEELWKENLHSLYRNAWEKEDHLHEGLLEKYFEWSKYHVTMPFLYTHCYKYVTAGSSEAIREALAGYKATVGSEARIHLFKGEYEGFFHYAKAYGIEVVFHDREDYKMSVRGLNIKKHEVFIVSQPSAIDGNIWNGFGEFLNYVYRFLTVWVDLAYVGTIGSGNKSRIDLRYRSIDKIFFSLSKPFGVYFHRIGGVYSCTPMLGLEGNKFFKNKFSLVLGRKLMDTYSPVDLPERYRLQQVRSAERLRTVLYDGSIHCSDVLLLVTGLNGPIVEERFKRGNCSRYCVTPLLNELTAKE